MSRQIVRMTIPDELYEELRMIAAEKKMTVRRLVASAFEHIAKDHGKREGNVP